MNALDERILAIIEKNSRVGIKELAVLLGTNEEEVINSMERLENNGIICGYHTDIEVFAVPTEVYVCTYVFCCSLVVCENCICCVLVDCCYGLAPCFFCDRRTEVGSCIELRCYESAFGNYYLRYFRLFGLFYYGSCAEYHYVSVFYAGVVVVAYTVEGTPCEPSCVRLFCCTGDSEHVEGDKLAFSGIYADSREGCLRHDVDLTVSNYCTLFESCVAAACCCVVTVKGYVYVMESFVCHLRTCYKADLETVAYP